MNVNTFQILISVFFLIFIGYFSKISKIIDEDFAKKAIKFLFFLPLPLLVFLSFATTKLDFSLGIFPIISVFIQFCLIAISFFIGKLLKFDNKSTGTLIAAAGISSTLVFALPFIQAFYGTENLKYLFMYDFGNGLMAWTVIYLITGHLGNKKSVGIKKGILNFAKNPMIFALIGGIIFGLLGIELPLFFTQIKQTLGGLINPLLFIVIGILLDFKYFFNKENITKLFLSAGVVMGISVLLAYFFTSIFGISGIGQKVILIAAISPAATLAVAFSVEHDLDQKYASALVAFTMVLGIVFIPLIILL
ncbi:MAG: AEC family transporter [bacterium]|nr:AEC family transporter [bacterium]